MLNTIIIIIIIIIIVVQIPPYPSQNAVQCPTLGSIQVIKCPRPRDISQAHENDRRTTETPSVVEQILYKYSKQFAFNIIKTDKHCRRIYYEQNSRAKRQKSPLESHWLLSFSACVMENPTYWDYYIPYMQYRFMTPFHWHASSLTLLKTYMRQVKEIDLCWAFYCCIESPV